MRSAVYRLTTLSRPKQSVDGVPSYPTLNAKNAFRMGHPARTGEALDRAVEPGKTYRYLAQQVVQIHVGDRTLEMAGQFSPPAVIDTAGGEGK